MRAKEKCCLRPEGALVFLFVILLFIPALASSEETYKFERMWPDLLLQWNFRSPADGAIDGGRNVYVADTGNDRIRKFSQDGVWIKSSETSVIEQLQSILNNKE